MTVPAKPIRSACMLPVLALSLFAAESASKYELSPDQRTGSIKRILVLCHSHLDIGFTRPPDEVARDYKDNIDAAIRLTREHPDFRWTIESAWMLEEWLRRTADEQRIEELGRMLRDGRMGLGVTFANMHSGLMAAEESNRLVYVGERLRRRFGIQTTIAYQNDVPGFTWAYPRILAGSGVQRLITGLNLFIGGGNNLGVAQNPFYWVGPDGSRVLTWFAYDSYVEGYRWNLRSPASIADLEKSVPRRLAWLEKNGYRYDTYLMMASPGDNTHPHSALRILETIREWNARNPELPMKMATAEEFFDDLVKRYGDRFPSASGDAAGHWEIVKLRVPEAAPRMREASYQLPAAETAAAIAGLLTGIPYPRFDVREAWYSLLSFHEHTADSGGGWPGYFSRWDVDWSNIAHYSDAIKGYSNVRQTLRKALARIGSASVGVSPGPASGDTAAVMVYNGLSWRRDGPVVVENLPVALRTGSIEVVDDASGKALSWEEVPGTKRHIVFYATDVPAVGYRMYTLRRAEAKPQAAGAEPLVDVSVDEAGWITSISDRTTRRELVRSNSERRFGALMISRERGAFVPESLGAGKVEVSNGPVAKRIRVSRPGSMLPVTEVTLYRGAGYADLRFEVDLARTPERSYDAMRYGLALPLPASRQMYMDGPGFVMRIPEDILPGGRAPHFTPATFVHQQTGVDWGVTLATRDAGILSPDDLFVLAAEGFESHTRDEGVQRLYRTEPRSTPVLPFRFRITTHGTEKAEWSRFGAELNLPLNAQVLRTGRPLVPVRGWFEVSDPRIQLLAFKPAEQLPGWYMIRLQEMSGTQVQGVRVSTPFRVAEAEAANLVEQRSGRAVDLANIALGPWQTATIIVRLEQ